jgi:carbon monoxide dehydrogenase subunit G
MIETEQTVLVNVGIDDTWTYARDMQRWASIMPGYQDCTIIDDDNSLWILKIGVGGLVRTVKVAVHVDEWAGPASVRFSVKLQGDPVEGGGTYHAVAQGPNQTQVNLKVYVSGSGPMAPMWEAMGGPVLPKFARSFAEQLKGMIEEAMGVPASAATSPARPASFIGRIGQWFASLWRIR